MTDRNRFFFLKQHLPTTTTNHHARTSYSNSSRKHRRATSPGEIRQGDGAEGRNGRPAGRPWARPVLAGALARRIRRAQIKARSPRGVLALWEQRAAVVRCAARSSSGSSALSLALSRWPHRAPRRRCVEEARSKEEGGRRKEEGGRRRTPHIERATLDEGDPTRLAADAPNVHGRGERRGGSSLSSDDSASWSASGATPSASRRGRAAEVTRGGRRCSSRSRTCRR